MIAPGSTPPGGNDPGTDSAPYAPRSLLRRVVGWNSLGALVILTAVSVSLFNVMSIRSQHAAPHKRIVRLMHWQLELGYRDALQRVIDDYNQMQAQRYHAGAQEHLVEVVQLPVTEKIYGQVLKVNLIAGTAPDIFAPNGAIELARDCANLSGYVNLPNPYNATEYLSGEHLEPGLAGALSSLPWRETYIDSMRGGFNSERQTQYGVPISFILGGRFAYNLDLLREITGSERIPATTGELLELGRKTRAYAERTGRAVWPIAASKYNASYFTYDLASVMLQPWSRILDADRDGDVTNSEGWAALAAGRVDFSDRVFVDYLDAAQSIAKQFATGFGSMDRDGGMYLFVQQKTPAFFCSSWDAGTVINLARGRFRVAFDTIPVPGPGEPWSEPPRRPVSEASIVTTSGLHVNLNGNVAEAVDFLRYLTSYPVNQRFNRGADWIPAIIGTSPSPHMASFTPRIAGTTAAWTPSSPWGELFTGGQTALVLQGQIAGLTTGEISKERLIARIKDTFADEHYGANMIWARDYVDTRNASRFQERSIGIMDAVDLCRGQEPDPAVRRDMLWIQMPLLGGQSVRWRHQNLVGALRTDGRAPQQFPEVDP